MAGAGDGLNLAQQEAVNYLHGPCLVLAGAGSGKTRVITHKIARLIQCGTEPERIAAITFTNKAAAEMRERSRGLIGKAAGAVLLCTFHALGVRLLREDGAALGLQPRFSILDTDDVTQVLKDAGGTTDNATARQWQWTISAWKAAGVSVAQAQAAAQDDFARTAAQVMGHYQERLLAYNAVDFDDLIALPLKLLRDHTAVRERWQQRLGHILVDEYQDTNASQYQLLKLLVGGVPPAQARLTAVGDDDQSIYGWRGATLDNLRQLPLDFPSLKVIKLEQNYRSTGAILAAANNVIAPNPKLFPKSLWSALGPGEPVRVIDADHEEHEAERVVARIESLRAQTGLVQPGAVPHEFRDFAVLYRANHQAKPLEKALRRAQIPYKVSGGTSFFDRTEIRDLCAWLRLWSNPSDDPAFLRAITTPRRGIGHQTLAHLGDFARGYRLSLFKSLSSPSLPAVLPARAVHALHEFGHQIGAQAESAARVHGATAARRALEEWLREMGYEQHLRDTADSPAMAAARWNNVQEFCDWMAQRCGDGADPVTAQPLRSLLEVGQTIALLSTLSERETEQNVVTLSTLHAAKGLEWPHVVLVGANEGVLPFRTDEEASAQDQVAHVQEERRLMYVGITRAQRTLAVTWSRKRKRGRELVTAQPSRFIAEMALDQSTAREDPRAKLKALRAEFAQRAQAQATKS